MNRRKFIAGLGAAASWPLVARAQQPALPVVSFIDGGSADVPAGSVAAFREGLGEAGYVEGQNVTVEYHWLEGKYDRLPSLMADLVRRRVAVLASPSAAPLRSRPKRRQRPSQLFSASVKTRSNWDSSPASPGRAATRPALII